MAQHSINIGTAANDGTGDTLRVAFGFINTDLGEVYSTLGTLTTAIAAKPALGETSSTAYRGDRGKTAYDFSQTATTAGAAFVALTNPGAITFLRVNADNSVTALSASAFRTAIGAGTSNFDATSSGSLAGVTGITAAAGQDIVITSGLGVAKIKVDSAGFDVSFIGGVMLGNGNQAAIFTPGYAQDIPVNGGVQILYATGAVKSLYERFGSGTPEGAVTAPVGAVYHRTDGGAGTSFYVKESGTGNTGWVAK